MKADTNYFRMPPFMVRHRLFAFAISVAIAVLYAEAAWFLQKISNVPHTVFALLNIALISGAGYLLSFWLPAQIFPESKLISKEETGMIPFLANQWAISVLCVAITSGLAWRLTLSVVVDSTAMADYQWFGLFFLKAFFGAVYVHGCVTYIRYVEYLYVRREDQPIKILTITASLAVVSVAVALILFFRDLDGLNHLPMWSDSNVWGLHIYFRGLYWISLMAWVYLWHIVCLADH